MQRASQTRFNANCRGPNASPNASQWNIVRLGTQVQGSRWACRFHIVCSFLFALGTAVAGRVRVYMEVSLYHNFRNTIIRNTGSSRRHFFILSTDFNPLRCLNMLKHFKTMRLTSPAMQRVRTGRYLLRFKTSGEFIFRTEMPTGHET